MKIKHSPIRSKDLTVEEITAADEMRRMLVSQINPARLKQVLADAELLRGNFGASCPALGAGSSWNIRIRDGFESCHVSGNGQKEFKSYSVHC